MGPETTSDRARQCHDRVDAVIGRHIAPPRFFVMEALPPAHGLR